MIKKITAVTLSVLMLGTCTFPSFAESAPQKEVFFDDFDGESLDTEKWLIAHKNWGGAVTENGEKVDYNGGVIPENVAVQDGKLLLTGLGNMYDGCLRGVNRNMTQRSNGKRTGGAIATKDYFASGSYEIRAKISPDLGACSAMWTFEYEEDYTDGLVVTNHEIDIEFPGKDENGDFSLQHALCTTWVGENEGEYLTESVYCGNQTDGEYHTYRFDWHTGSDTEVPRVEYYFDNVLTYTSYDYIPSNAGRLWLGLWFPRYWAGTPYFDTTVFEVDYIKITPFNESGDKPENESYPDDGWGTEAVITEGDVNFDGICDGTDLTALQQYIVCCEKLVPLQKKAADLNNDGSVNVYDLNLMKRYLCK